MGLVAYLDLLALGGSLAALLFLCLWWRRALRTDTRVLLAVLFLASAFYCVCVLLEWSGYTTRLETFEDLTAAMLPMGWGFLFYSLSQRLADKDLRRYRDHLEELVAERTRELEDAQEQLLRKERLAALGQLTGAVSHEIRNPLATIGGSVALIDKSVRGSDPLLDRALDRTHRGIRRCDRIIQELLDYARVRPIDLQPILVDDWLSAVLDEQEIPPGIALVRDPGSGARVRAEEGKLSRCVINLIANACDAVEGTATDAAAGAEGVYGTVTVASRLEGGRVAIRVRDTGGGISAEDMEKIFEPLFSTKSFGVGLGLAIVKQIMEQHGGTVTIESAPGEGTTASLHLPAVERDV